MSELIYEKLKRLKLDKVSIGDVIDEIDRLRTHVTRLIEFSEEVIRISDRKHDAWDKLKKEIKLAKEKKHDHTHR